MSLEGILRSLGVAVWAVVMLSMPARAVAAESDPTAPADAWVFPELELMDSRPAQDLKTSAGTRERKWLGEEASAAAAALGAGGTEGLLSTQWSSTATGTPGESASLLGLGRRGDDVSVATASGIPLDPPQGGGFDLNSLPSFLWQGVSMEEGPARLDAASVHRASADVTLLPWIDLFEAPRGVVLGGASSLGVGQVAGGRNWGPTFGALAGWNFGAQQGPGLSVRTAARLTELWRIRAELLGAEQTSLLKGSDSYPTPGAQQESSRWLPSLQLERRSVDGDSADPVFRLAISGDQLGLNYRDEGHGIETSDLSRRFRAAAAFRILGSNRVSLEASESTLTQDLSGSARETDRERVAAAAWSTSVPLGDGALLEPQIRWVSVQGVGVEPEASLRWAGRVTRDFVAVSWTRKFPTLLDRYYQFPPFFSGNPNLRPEGIATLRAGLGDRRFGDGLLELRAEGYLQRRQDLILSSGFATPSNGGEAWVAALEPGFRAIGRGWLRGWSLDQELEMIASRMTDASGERSPIPLQPAFRSGTSLSYRTGRWSAVAAVRGISALPVAAHQNLPAFAVASLELGCRLSAMESWLRGADLVVRADDLFDRKPEQIPDFRGPGRAFSVALSADLD